MLDLTIIENKELGDVFEIQRSSLPLPEESFEDQGVTWKVKGLGLDHPPKNDGYHWILLCEKISH